MRAAGYCRVSSLEQCDGTSLHSQEEQIRAYVKMRGIDLVAVLIDSGVSGGKPLAERPEGAKLVDMIEEGQIDACIIVKLDRGFRDTVDCLQTVEAWEKKKVALHVIDLGGSSVDSVSPAGRFMLTVLVAAAEMERGRIKERCAEGRKIRRLQGCRLGEIPFGYALGSDGKSLVESREEQEAIALALDLRSQGYSASGIAAELNRRGIATKKGSTWTHKQVIRLLKRAA